MNETGRYSDFALCREMMETPAVVRRFDSAAVEEHLPAGDALMLSGEGSSRIFPAKRTIARALRGRGLRIHSEGAMQAAEYDLSGFHLYVASNSGKTAEVVRLLRGTNASRTSAVVAHGGTPIASLSDSTYVLGCGSEQAVAATKSVVEQALFYDSLFRRVEALPGIDTDALAGGLEAALALEIPEGIVSAGRAAPTLYFAGRNDGVAEELTLKTNEITRKRSDFLEGTYAVHGIEEVMHKDELIVVIDPFPEEEEKFHQVLARGIGLSIVAIASRETSFPTIRVPDLGELNPYLQLVAGWNLLVEIGLAAGVDLDKPERARKVGNEFVG